MKNLIIILIIFINSFIYSQNIWGQLGNSKYDFSAKNIFQSSNGKMFSYAEFTDNPSRSWGVFLSIDEGINWELLPQLLSINDFAENSKKELFAASWQGIYKWIDSANYWENVYGQAVILISVGPNDEIFAKSNVADYNLLCSTDNGTSWTELNCPSTQINSMAINDSGTIFLGSYNGLYRSTTSGNSWEYVYSSSYITDIDCNKNGYVLITTVDDVRISSDNGESWEKISDNIKDDNPPLEPFWSSAISENNEIYCTFGYPAGIYRTFDLGKTWEKFIIGSPASLPEDIIIAQNEKLYTATDRGIFSSSDKGENWEGAAKLISNRQILSLASNNNYTFAGTDAGLYQSSDDGENWSQINKGINFYGGGAVNSIVIDDSNNIYSSIYINGIYYSKDNGNSWDPTSLRDTIISCISVDTNNYLFASIGLEFLRSTNNGFSWEKAGNVPNEKSLNKILINDRNIIYGGTSNGLYKSTNQGSSWQLLGLNGEAVTAILEENNFIFAGTETNGIYRSSDKGNNWFQQNSGLNNLAIRDIAININGNLLTATANGVFVSFNNGESWFEYNQGLNNKSVNCIIFNSKNKAFAGTDVGLYKTEKLVTESPVQLYFYPQADTLILLSGKSSSKIKFSYLKGNTTSDTISILPQDSTDFLVIDSSGLRVPIDTGYFIINDPLHQYEYEIFYIPVFQSTLNPVLIPFDSVFYSKDHYFDIQLIIKKDKVPIGSFNKHFFADFYLDIKKDQNLLYEFSLSQNFPNPFNPATKIQYEISGRYLVILKVYNILGQEIETLVNQEQPAGVYEINFNATNLPSGIYFYELKAGNFIEAKKMILLR